MSTCRHLQTCSSSAMADNTSTTPELGSRSIQSIILAFVVLAMSPVRAADLSLEIGRSWSGKSELGSTHAGFVQAASDNAFTVLDDRFQLNPIATVGVVAGRDESINHHDVWLIGMGVRIKRVAQGPNYWFLESKVFIASKDTPSLSGHLQFGNGFGYAHRAWKLKVLHLSNARLREPNHGETMLLVGYRF